MNNIALCSYEGETGCIVAYDSVAAGDEEKRPVPLQPRPCVDPTDLGGEPGVAAMTIYNSDEGIPFPEGVETYWIGHLGLYSAACESDGYLGIGVVPGRSTLYTPDLIQAVFGGSLHQTDHNIGMGDLLRIVDTQAANF